MKIDNKAIGKKIKFYRQQKSFTQEEFAEAIGVSPGYVSRLERGIKRAGLETLMEYSAFSERSPKERATAISFLIFSLFSTLRY